MIGYADLARWFGEPKVIRPSPRVVEKLPLLENAKTTLRELGLPLFMGESTFFPLFTSDLTRGSSDLVEFERPGRRQEKLLRIGATHGEPGLAICVVESSGEVVLLRLEASRRETFMNSNLWAFVEFLYIVSRDQATFEGGIEEEVDVANQELKGKLSSVDPAAFDSLDYFWPVLISMLTI